KCPSYCYQPSVPLAAAITRGTDGEIIGTVEESKGTVQNVMEAARRSGNYVFTTPPALVRLAQGGQAMFEDEANPKFDEIRALFPIPSLTMHFVTRADSNITSFADLEGKTVLIGTGSFGAREGAKYLELFGLEGKVTLADAALNAAVSALKNRQIDGFVTAGSYPAPNVIEAAASVGINVLSLNEEQITLTGRTRLVIPAGTYQGVDSEIVTTSLPVIAYTTSEMGDDTAYELTKTYWSQKTDLGNAAAWWNGVSEEMLVNIYGKLHPGALRYYDEVGIDVPDSLR
ncbi:TRAP transporter solute receptor, TAXI family precursor, partial [hydrothermal vent metagenome]